MANKNEILNDIQERLSALIEERNSIQERFEKIDEEIKELGGELSEAMAMEDTPKSSKKYYDKNIASKVVRTPMFGDATIAQKIIICLEKASRDEGMNAHTLYSLIKAHGSVSKGSINTTLSKLKSSGQIESLGKGYYVLA